MYKIKSIRSIFACAILTLLSVGVTPIANALPLTWSLQNVTFADGGTASGTFSYDAVLNKYFAWNLQVKASGGYPEFTYINNIETWKLNAGEVINSYYLDCCSYLPTELIPAKLYNSFGDYSNYLVLSFETPLSDILGDTINLTSGPCDINWANSVSWCSMAVRWEIGSGQPVDKNFIVSGQVTATSRAIPEPVTPVLLLSGLALVGFMARHRKNNGA